MKATVHRTSMKRKRPRVAKRRQIEEGDAQARRRFEGGREEEKRDAWLE